MIRFNCVLVAMYMQIHGFSQVVLLSRSVTSYKAYLRMHTSLENNGMEQNRPGKPTLGNTTAYHTIQGQPRAVHSATRTD